MPEEAKVCMHSRIKSVALMRRELRPEISFNWPQDSTSWKDPLTKSDSGSL